MGIVFLSRNSNVLSHRSHEQFLPMIDRVNSRVKDSIELSSYWFQRKGLGQDRGLFGSCLTNCNWTAKYVFNSDTQFKQKRGNSYVDQTYLYRYATWFRSDYVFCQSLTRFDGAILRPRNGSRPHSFDPGQPGSTFLSPDARIFIPP